jgi:hypothetical protein
MENNVMHNTSFVRARIARDHEWPLELKIPNKETIQNIANKHQDEHVYYAVVLFGKWDSVSPSPKDFRYTSESNTFSPNMSCCSDQSTGTLFIRSANFKCLGCSPNKMASFSLGAKKFKRKINWAYLAVISYRSHNSSGVIVVIAHSVDYAKELYTAGASYVIMPHHLGAHHAALMIARHGFESARFEEEKLAHLEKLLKQKS